ncbi:7TM diverse intracellular signaling domain-containing protein [Pedobacter heparinus]|uniref:histidine kinase n=1 Tax=Pedobacter heparinus (strain ATCC 13125 / DSM 2366 / CIP 104194 / JCM 7457 / NBRC 12017 / NCIMB 9290 / NRRL B-14731 / HIM 762-3) TaxID=485917 RepID=C6XTV3_PEDHD|nr:7TM diverse intracellular signaling domain-containing protein [Pedobacter heparinus]ACU03739.1 ATP-binding region ATPase domain protein [Pedobacter heparinus DSM 2366]
MSRQHIRNLFLTGIILLFTVYVNASTRAGKENIMNPDIQTQDSLINILHFSKLYISKSDTIGIRSVIAKEAEFKKPVTNIINIGNYPNAVWIKAVVPPSIDIKDYTDILIDQPRLKQAEVYFVKDNEVLKKFQYNNYTLVASVKTSGNLKTFKIPKDIAALNPVIYIKLYSDDVVISPVFISKSSNVLELFSVRDVFFGIYTGIMLIMFAYNLFLYFSVKDVSYLNYIFCILFTWLTQTTIQGYFDKYFYVDSLWFNSISVILFSNLGLIASILFTKSFLNTKKNTARLHKVLNILLVLTVISTILLFIGYKKVSFIGMQVSIFGGSIVTFISALNAYYKRNFKPAGYYLASWSFLFIGMMIFILKDYEIIKYSIFSTYSVQFASVLEVLLLSFALADRINFFKNQNELAQKQALLVLKENERLVREQNIELENKVNERTIELQNTNSSLNVALTNLKDAQSQLVDAEKMAALGQLTAGIAHEINNPINFVTSNIKPLQLDIDDLKEIITKYEQIDYSGADVMEQVQEIEAFKKQIDLDFINNEIESLLTGITDGAKRTAEIIRSLRNFSRLDEDDLKPIDINEGLHSTLVLVRNSLPDNVKVIKDFGNLPKIECLPGKINQVFMNLISNAIQAIKSNGKNREEELLTIHTWYDDNNVKISIKDTGTGMTDEVKHKIFEPFFTTKEVGEGTGLGLSIVFSIIEKHKGHIDVLSEVDQGTEFIITLPVNTQ